MPFSVSRKSFRFDARDGLAIRKFDVRESRAADFERRRAGERERESDHEVRGSLSLFYENHAESLEGRREKRLRPSNRERSLLNARHASKRTLGSPLGVQKEKRSERERERERS